MNRIDRRVVGEGGMNGIRLVSSPQLGDVWPAFFTTGLLGRIAGQQTPLAGSFRSLFGTLWVGFRRFVIIVVGWYAKPMKDRMPN